MYGGGGGGGLGWSHKGPLIQTLIFPQPIFRSNCFLGGCLLSTKPGMVARSMSISTRCCIFRWSTGLLLFHYLHSFMLDGPTSPINGFDVTHRYWGHSAPSPPPAAEGVVESRPLESPAGWPHSPTRGPPSPTWLGVQPAANPSRLGVAEHSKWQWVPADQRKNGPAPVVPHYNPDLHTSTDGCACSCVCVCVCVFRNLLPLSLAKQGNGRTGPQ